MPETVFLTGATGQVGAALLPRLLDDPDVRVVALIRAKDAEHLRERRDALRAGLGEAGARFDAVAGDTQAPGLGLDSASAERLRGEVDAVLHSAAAVRFDLPPEELERQNVGGTREAMAFARSLGGRLRRYDHVSTAYVAGMRRERCLESELDCGQGFRNGYERSKCLAEKEVHASGLPWAIHRPAIVVGDSRTGETRAFNVLYWPLKIYSRGWWRTFPGRPDVRVDCVPVDWVASALASLRRDPTTLGRTFHLAGGDDAPTVGELEARIREITGGPPIRYVHPRLYRRFFRPLLWPFRLTKRGRAIFTGGTVFLPYFEGNPLFDTTNIRGALGQAGKPPSAVDYFETILRYALRRDFGADRRGTAA